MQSAGEATLQMTRSAGNIGEGEASHTRQFQCGLIEVWFQDFVGRFLGGH